MWALHQVRAPVYLPDPWTACKLPPSPESVCVKLLWQMSLKFHRRREFYEPLVPSEMSVEVALLRVGNSPASKQKFNVSLGRDRESNQYMVHLGAPGSP